jgi:hypothetical protein
MQAAPQAIVHSAVHALLGKARARMKCHRTMVCVVMPCRKNRTCQATSAFLALPLKTPYRSHRPTSSRTLEAKYSKRKLVFSRTRLNGYEGK